MPKFELRRYTIQELANLYGVSRKTMWRWVRSAETGPKLSRCYSTAQVKIIIDRLGKP